MNSLLKIKGEIIYGSVSNGAYYAEELLKNSPFLDMYIKERGIDTHVEKAAEVVALDSIMRDMYFQGGHVIPYLSVEI